MCYRNHSFQVKKQEIISKFQRKAYDTGSSEVQSSELCEWTHILVALLTERIRRLTEHLWYHHKVENCWESMIDRTSVRSDACTRWSGREVGPGAVREL